MPFGNTAVFSETATGSAPAVDWETDYAAIPEAAASDATTVTVQFAINEGDTATTVAQNLALAYNSANGPGFHATAKGASVKFTALNTSQEVVDMRFIISGLTTNIPANDGTVQVGNTGVYVKDANS